MNSLRQNREIALQICNTLKKAGHEVFFVGGAVRDSLLGRKPKEYDIVTSATPQETSQLFAKVVPLGIKFGIVVVVEDGFPFEIATFREEGQYRDGRHPDAIRFSSASSDVLRRDFTINGLLQEPNGGEIIDFIGGVTDLHQGIIRTIGKPHIRFGEDFLRMLRAVRFAGELGFAIEEETMAAIKAHCQEIKRISKERIKSEITKILTSDGARRSFELLAETGLLAEIIPEMVSLKGCPQPPEYHPEGDVWEHTLRVLEEIDKTENPPPALSWAGLLHDIGKPRTFSLSEGKIHFYGHDYEGARMAEAIASRFCFSSADKKLITALIEKHMWFINADKMNGGKFKRFIAEKNFPLLLELHRWDALASSNDLKSYYHCQNALKEMSNGAAEPLKLVNGNDLLCIGIPAGPLLGKILMAIEEAQLEGRIKSREEALSWAKQISQESIPKS
ncbi:MAG: CCA tRNA nucleotidyltransferase [Deltaproteobacteria bacterium]|nr:CCA tRNA nucleotidyltransferase [Deltaproteobacteria bacterium]